VCVAVTSTPGNTAPLWSFTVPAICAVDCAEATLHVRAEQNNAVIRKSRTRSTRVFIPHSFSKPSKSPKIGAIVTQEGVILEIVKKSGVADLPLHGGRVPQWLAERMAKMGTAVAESVVDAYGTAAFLSRLSDPFWFQALGAVMGMDWHSSGITTSVVGALKRGLAPRADELGVYVCGGRGRVSRNTPQELLNVAERRGLDGETLVRTSRLTARVDNNAIADGFQIYLHSFVVTSDREWAVVPHGLNERRGMARRYPWRSATVRDFVVEPHTGIVGENQGVIMNLVDARAKSAQTAMLDIARENPENTLNVARRLKLPSHHEVRAENVDLK